MNYMRNAEWGRCALSYWGEKIFTYMNMYIWIKQRLWPLKPWWSSEPCLCFLQIVCYFVCLLKKQNECRTNDFFYCLFIALNCWEQRTQTDLSLWHWSRFGDSSQSFTAHTLWTTEAKCRVSFIVNAHCRGHRQIYWAQSSTRYKSVHTYTFTLQQREVIYLYRYVISDTTKGSSAITNICLQLPWPPICSNTMKCPWFSITSHR